MWKDFTANDTKKYIKVLNNIVHKYKNTVDIFSFLRGIRSEWWAEEEREEQEEGRRRRDEGKEKEELNIEWD